MKETFGQSFAGKWRGFFILATLLLALQGLQFQSAAASQAQAASPFSTSLPSRLTRASSFSSALYTDKLPVGQANIALSGVSRGRAAYGLASQTAAPPDLVPAPPDVSRGGIRYFPDTAHFLRGAFLSYWQTHGATDVLGLPITEPIVEDGLTVQYLERARLEWHPENAEAKNRVLLTRLGATLVQTRGLTFAQATPASPGPATYYFVETGHNLSNAFLSYWQRNGGLAVFGYPLSEEMVETSPTDGQTHTVQYFERNRFEWHPENPPAFNVQLGLLGSEYSRLQDLNPLARVLVAEPVGDGSDLSKSPELAQLVDPDLLPAVQELARTPQFTWVPALLISYSIPIGFTDIGEEGVAGAFITTRSRTSPYAIVIPTSERDASPLSLASVIAHEATHAYDVTAGVVSSRLQCSVEEELRAYMNGFAAWVVLQGPEALTQDYTPGSLDAAVNRSLIGFNGGSDIVSLDFSATSARKFLRGLYGSSCGK